MYYVLTAVIGLIVASMINAFSDPFKFSLDFFKHYYIFLYKKPVYIIIEVITVLLFIYIYSVSDTAFNVVKFCFLTGILIAASALDIKKKLISNKLIIFSFSVGILINFISLDFSKVFDAFLALIITGSVLLILYFVSRGSIGIGDIKLISCMSIFLGLQAIISVFFIAVVLSGLAGLVLLLFKAVRRKGTIPFAPFLLVGFIIMLRYL
jgi:leader peptidase (prepilin peptidase) / N-methyltransferase